MLVDIFNTDARYDLLYADPPWKQSRGGYKRVRPRTSGVSLDYQTLTFDEIREQLRVADSLTGENSVLFLWSIDRYLIDAQRIAESLGYKLHARMVWNKIVGIPAAFTVRFGHEYLLYMYKGKLIPVATDERGKIHTVFAEKPSRHSQKPIAAYRIIERLYPNLRKLEMYARTQRIGWDCWGDEVSDILR